MGGFSSERRQSLAHLQNALNQISKEEKKKSLKQRLTQLQKNRIALNYLKYREQSNNELSSILRKSDLNDNSDFLSRSQTPSLPEQKPVLNLMSQMNDYLSGKDLTEPTRSSVFIRSRNTDQTQMYGINPYKPRSSNIIQGKQKSLIQNDLTNRSASQNQGVTSKNKLDQSPFGFHASNRISNLGFSTAVSKALNKDSFTQLASGDNTSKSTKVMKQDASTLAMKKYLDDSLYVINETALPYNNRFNNDKSRTQQQWFNYRAKSQNQINNKLDRIKIQCKFALQESSDKVFQEAQDHLVQDLTKKSGSQYREKESFQSELSNRSQRLQKQVRKMKELGLLEDEEEVEDEQGQMKMQLSNSSINPRQHYKTQTIFTKHRENLQSTDHMKSFCLLKESLLKKQQKSRILQSYSSTRKYEQPSLNEDETPYSNILSIKPVKTNRMIYGLQNKQSTHKNSKVLLNGNMSEEELTKQADRMIEKINYFEKTNHVNKISVKEISDKYKEFNLRRNHRIKNRAKLCI